MNIAAGRLRGHLEESVPQVVIWCLAHPLELSLKDALKGTLFTFIEDMLLRACYSYHKSPKKCRELDEVVVSLQISFGRQRNAMLKDGANTPVRACGAQFVSHEVTAIHRPIDQFCHLKTLEKSAAKS